MTVDCGCCHLLQTNTWPHKVLVMDCVATSKTKTTWQEYEVHLILSGQYLCLSLPWAVPLGLSRADQQVQYSGSVLGQLHRHWPSVWPSLSGCYWGYSLSTPSYNHWLHSTHLFQPYFTLVQPALHINNHAGITIQVLGQCLFKGGPASATLAHL